MSSNSKTQPTSPVVKYPIDCPGCRSLEDEQPVSPGGCKVCDGQGVITIETTEKELEDAFMEYLYGFESHGMESCPVEGGGKAASVNSHSTEFCPFGGAKRKG